MVGLDTSVKADVTCCHFCIVTSQIHQNTNNLCIYLLGRLFKKKIYRGLAIVAASLPLPLPSENFNVIIYL